jgi:hypothetical protein
VPNASKAKKFTSFVKNVWVCVVCVKKKMFRSFHTVTLPPPLFYTLPQLLLSISTVPSTNTYLQAFFFFLIKTHYDCDSTAQTSSNRTTTVPRSSSLLSLFSFSFSLVALALYPLNDLSTLKSGSVVSKNIKSNSYQFNS